MKLIAKKNFELGGIFYEAGNEVEVKSKDILVRLNEKGFIESLTPKQIQDFGKEPRFERRIEKKEED